MKSDTLHPTKYWHRLNDNRIQCDLCPRYCKLKSGQRGLCFIRVCQDEKIFLSSYARSSGFCIDPIEKKPLNHFLPGTPVLSFGTAGCNLACKFCQNWDMSKSRQMETLAQSATPEQISNAAVQSSSRAVAFTYNDPVIFMEYAIDVAQACSERNIKTVAVSAGYICDEPRIEFFKSCDAANIDLKAFSENFYWKLTGAHLQTVLDTLKYIKSETNVWLEITTLIIPGENDSQAELEKMSQWLFDNLGPDVPLHLTAFHPDWKMMNTPATPKSTLTKARSIALEAGLNYVYTGNVHDKESQSTYCSQCQELLIGRNWYELSEWNLDRNGSCNNCGSACAGVFEHSHGVWGAQRKPISIGQYQI